MSGQVIDNAMNVYLKACLDHMRATSGILQNTNRPFITISRETGAGGITIAKKLEEKLNALKPNPFECKWTNFDKRLIHEILKENDLPETMAKYFKEDKTSEIKDIIDELFGNHPNTISLVRKTSHTILHLAQAGYCILVGRGSNLITHQLKHGTHVRLVSSKHHRIEHIMKYYQCTKEEAEAKIKEEDGGKKRYLHEYFSQDVNNPCLYDIIINTDHVDYDHASEIIFNLVLTRFKDEQ